jgi:hypothetical protein
MVVGEIVRLSARTVNANGKAVGHTKVQWTSQDESIAEVSEDGVVKARGPGRVLIQASSDGNENRAGGRLNARAEVLVTQGNDGVLRAFPEAEGHGANALSGCRRDSPRIVPVTNLDDSGPGSLRDAISRADGDRLTIVVFGLGGYIDLSSRVDIDRGCLYVAGQTAPGDGITIRRWGLRFRYDAEDIVLRHIRMRLGYQGDVQGHIPINITAGSRIVLDHVSLSWSTDLLVTVSKVPVESSRPISDVTIQRTVLSEPLAYKPVAMAVGSGKPKEWEGDTPPAWSEVRDVSVHHNLFANSHHRNPNVGALNVEVVNNVVYNWKMDAGALKYGGQANWINNYLKAGPMLDSWRYELTYSCGTYEQVVAVNLPPSLYLSGNIGPRHLDADSDPWEGTTRMIACYNDTEGTAVTSDLREFTPLASSDHPIAVTSAASAFEEVLSDVGANGGLACDGKWVWRPDAVDKRVIEETRSNQGPGSPPANEGTVGGYPSLDRGTACLDSDRDGMPDEFESRFGLDPAFAGDANIDPDGDGYTNVEEYVNSSAPI